MSGPAPAAGDRPGAQASRHAAAPLDVVAVLAALQDQIDDLTAAVQAQQATLDDKLTALHSRLTDAVADLHSGPQWRAWLDVAGRFHTYSFNNVLAVSLQRPDATLVAGYQTWRAVGRQVGKGETGIQILAPIVRRAGDDGDQPTAGDEAGRGENAGRPADAGAGGPAGRRLASGSLTCGMSPRPPGSRCPNSPDRGCSPGRRPTGCGTPSPGWSSTGGSPWSGDTAGMRNGYTDFTARTVRVRGDVDEAQAAKTLLHEAAHTLLHDPRGPAAGGAGPVGGGPVGGGPVAASTAGGTREVEADPGAYDPDDPGEQAKDSEQRIVDHVRHVEGR